MLLFFYRLKSIYPRQKAQSNFKECLGKLSVRYFFFKKNMSLLSYDHISYFDRNSYNVL